MLARAARHGWRPPGRRGKAGFARGIPRRCTSGTSIDQRATKGPARSRNDWWTRPFRACRDDLSGARHTSEESGVFTGASGL
ncbi:predicted protein [Streptomyces sp. AA4]|nr:predicted protein [Streptomyces sp. AA4]